MDNFSNIGKAVIIQALGLQKNYIEVKESSVEELDFNNNSCKECKCHALLNAFDSDSETYKNTLELCQNCPNRSYTTKTVYKKIYHNEKNRYGYKPRLKSNSIKLFLLFHFYHPDRFGIIRNIDMRILSRQLNCDIKTIQNNLNILSRYSYISFSKTAAYTFNLCLNDYQNYYLPANKGGRGFFVLSKELLNELLNINNLLSLRIFLRELIEIDNLNAKGPFTAVSKTYKELKLSLPDYCKPCIIRKSMDSKNKIFDISFKDNVIRFEINDMYNARKQKSDCYDYHINQLNKFITDFNQTATYINTTTTAPSKYIQFFDDTKLRKSEYDHYKLLILKDFEIEDLAQLAVQYSYDLVLNAFSEVYKNYILFNKKVLNLGGLIRTIITSQYINFEAA